MATRNPSYARCAVRKAASPRLWVQVLSTANAFAFTLYDHWIYNGQIQVDKLKDADGGEPDAMAIYAHFSSAYFLSRSLSAANFGDEIVCSLLTA